MILLFQSHKFLIVPAGDGWQQKCANISSVESVKKCNLSSSFLLFISLICSQAVLQAVLLGTV